jgi:transglutaminase-like putative cysteine protease
MEVVVFVGLLLLQTMQITLAESVDDGCTSTVLDSRGMWQRKKNLHFNARVSHNMASHETDKFSSHSPDDDTSLVAKRGLSLEVFVRYFDCLKCPENPTFLLKEDPQATVKWTWTNEKQQGDTPVKFQSGYWHKGHCFRLLLPSSLPVGDYGLWVTRKCSGKMTTDFMTQVTVIFNGVPTLGSDSVRMKRDRTLTTSEEWEYLYNNLGFLWVGQTGIVWDYAVRSNTVKKARTLLEQRMNNEERNSPVLYARALTRLTGDPRTSDRVLEGRWTGEYADGVDPKFWRGSDLILEKWLAEKLPVRYGQCWVFAALLTTLLRSIGIPSRTVTNYESHHDRGVLGPRKERQYDQIQQRDESVWNFHVWTEAWLERQDLGQPFDWNVVDATPQEPSPLAAGNHFQTGPAYLPYIKAGYGHANYDTKFVMAEVNSSRLCSVSGELLQNEIGVAILTKYPGLDKSFYQYTNPLVLTGNYKHVVNKRSADNESVILPPPYFACQRKNGLRLSTTLQSPKVGQTFRVIISEGNSTVPLNNTVLQMDPIVYTRQSLGVVKVFQGSWDVQVTEMDYLPYLKNSSMFRFRVGRYNSTGDFELHDSLLVHMVFDSLSVQATQLNNSRNFSVVVMFTNPLSVPMTGTQLKIISPDDGQYLEHVSEILPAQSVSYNVTVGCGLETGPRFILASLDTDQTVGFISGNSLIECPSFNQTIPGTDMTPSPTSSTSGSYTVQIFSKMSLLQFSVLTYVLM